MAAGGHPRCSHPHKAYSQVPAVIPVGQHMVGDVQELATVTDHHLIFQYHTCLPTTLTRYMTRVCGATPM